MSVAAPLDQLRLPGLDLLDEIGRGAHSIVYRARHTRGAQGDLLVAVKIQRRHAAATEAAALAEGRGARTRLLREAAILGRVRHPALPKIMEVGESSGRLYLVMELVEGPTLASLLEAGPLSQRDTISLAQTLAAALAELHRFGLVHRDVKPHNVVLPAAAPGAATLVDFGFAAPAESDYSGGEVAGTLRYCAPEQAGMLKRPVDGRSDLYALGALLFECATGRPPFLADDAGELVRLHATQAPPSAAELNPDVTPAFAAIVARLLAKDPDDRYQTGGGLLRDLNRLERLDALLRAGEDVSLGGSDRAPRQTEETPLVGRDAPLIQLQRAWREALERRGGAVVVRGPAGSGKSRLVWEHLRRVRQDGGAVLHAKCVEGDPLPLAALRAALNGWLRLTSGLPRRERVAAETRLVAAAGERATLLRRLSPLLAQTLAAADSSLPTALSASDAEDADADRFHEAVADFFVRLLGDHPVGSVLFVDDAQWLDEGARTVLARIAVHLSRMRALVLCTARDDVPLEPLEASLAGASPLDVLLDPLDVSDTRRLIAAHLGGQAPDAVDRQLVTRIAALSGGSPFAVGEYVRALLEEGVLRPYWGGWTVDAEGLERLHLPAGVVQLLALRVAELPDQTRHILAAAAVLGPRFSAATLASVCDLPLEAAHTAIAEAERARLIERRSGGVYAVVHDQIRAVLEARLDASQRRALHQRAAIALDAGAPDASDAERVLRVASHYMLGEIERDPERVYAACVAAGTAARIGFADDEALRFLGTAHAVATTHGLPIDLEVEETLGQLSVRRAKWDDAVRYIGSALERQPDLVRRARLRCQLAEVHYSNRDTDRAWVEIRAGFAELGESFPMGKAVRALGTVGSWARAVLPSIPVYRPAWLQRVRRRAGSTEAGRARLRTLVDLYAIGAHVSYLDNRPDLMAQMLLRALLPARRIGPSHELVTTLSGYGILLATLGRQRLAARAAARAVAMARQIGDRTALGRALAAQAWARHVSGHPREAETLMRHCLEEHGQWMTAQDFISGCADISWSLAMRGHTREAWHWIQRALGRSQQASRRGHNLATNAAALLTVLGESAAAGQYLEHARVLVEESPATGWRAADYLARLVHILVEREELGGALDDALARHAACGFRPHNASFHARHFYVFSGYGALARAMRATAGGGTSATEPVGREALTSLAAAAQALHATGSHPTLRAHALIVEAGLKRLTGKRAAALLLLDRAERLASAAENVWAHFEITRQRAHAAAESGASERAAQLAREALALANEHGWVNRARWIRREFPGTATGGSLAARPTANLVREDDAPRPRRIERHLDALLKVSAATGAALDPDHVARVALDQVISLLGADRALLFLCPEYGEELAFTAGRTISGEDLDDLASDHSRTALEQLRATRDAVLLSTGISGGRGRELAATESIVAHDLRSVAAVPLLMPGRLVGALYVDSRIAGGVFDDEDVSVLRAIAGHIAVAVTVAQAFARQTTLAEENAGLLEQLSEQVDELQRSRQRVTEAEERQRREISELLHSRVQTKLLLASHRLAEYHRMAASDPGKAADLVDAVRDELDVIREQDVRKASHLLHPTIIRLGLVPALHLLAERFESDFRITISASPDVTQLDDPIENRLSEPLRLGAYRIVEEALGNAAKHAHPKTVELLLLLEQDQLVLRVRDDGKGFDAEAMRPGLGLASIHGRVDQLGGTWEISGAPGEGATLTVRLPLQAA